MTGGVGWELFVEQMHNQVPNPPRTGSARGALHLRTATGKQHLKKKERKKEEDQTEAARNLRRCPRWKTAITSVYASHLHVRCSQQGWFGFLERGGLPTPVSRPAEPAPSGGVDRDAAGTWYATGSEGRGTRRPLGRAAPQSIVPHGVLGTSLKAAPSFAGRRGFFLLVREATLVFGCLFWLRWRDRLILSGFALFIEQFQML